MLNLSFSRYKSIQVWNALWKAKEHFRLARRSSLETPMFLPEWYMAIFHLPPSCCTLQSRGAAAYLMTTFCTENSGSQWTLLSFFVCADLPGSVIFYEEWKCRWDTSMLGISRWLSPHHALIRRGRDQVFTLPQTTSLLLLLLPPCQTLSFVNVCPLHFPDFLTGTSVFQLEWFSYFITIWMGT